MNNDQTNGESIRLPTATLHVVLILLLAAIVGFYQVHFSHKAVHSEFTMIGRVADDNIEGANITNDPSEGLAQQELAEVISIADSIEARLVNEHNKEKDISDLVSEFYRLTEDRQWRVAWFVIESLLKREDFQHADQFARRLTKQVVAAANLEFELAIIDLRSGRQDESIRKFESILIKNPANSAAAINLGRLLLDKQLFKRAESVIKKGLLSARGEKRSKLLTLLSDLEFRQHKNEQAYQSIKQAIEFRPSVSYLWRRKALIEQALRDYSAADKSFRQALALNKNSKLTRRSYVDYLLNTFQFYAAYRQFNTLFKSNPKRVETAVNALGALWFSERSELVYKVTKRLLDKSGSRRLKQVSDALADFNKQQWRNGQEKIKKTLKKNRENDLAYLLIAQSYLAINKPKNANLYLKKITSGSRWFSLSAFYQIKAIALIMQSQSGKKVNSDPKAVFAPLLAKLPVASFNLQTCLKLLEDLYSSQAWFAGLAVIADLNPTIQSNRRIRLWQAKFNWRKGNQMLAIEQLQSLLTDEPEWPAALYRLAGYYRQVGKMAEADSSYHKLLMVEPEYSDAGFQAARVKVMMKDYNSASSLLKGFVEANPSHTEARLLLAQSECEINHIQQCRTQLDLLDRMSPHNPKLEKLKVDYSKVLKTQ